jgi:hypothetical protein
MLGYRLYALKRESRMSEVKEVVLIGDTNEERFKWFQALLAEVYEIGAAHARSFDDIRRFAKDKSLTARAVFLTDDLPFSDDPSKSTRDVSLNFGKLEEILRYADPVCIVTKEVDPTFSPGVEKRPHHVHLRAFPPTPEDRERTIIELGSLGRRLARFIDPSELARITKITTWDTNNRTLRRQIRSLSEHHDLKHGLAYLLRLIHKCLDCSSITGIEIKLLGQGKSGAAVFRFIISSSGQAKEYVLKLSNDLWKLESEVRGHLKARRNTGLPRYKEHVAALRPPVKSLSSTDTKPEHQYIVESGQWYAIHYDFLGGPGFGKFIDLETALIAAPLTLTEKTEGALPAYSLTSVEPNEVLGHRLKIFSTTLNGLCDILYGKTVSGGRRREVVWKIEDAEAEKFIPLPPYQLTERVKGWVQGFLDSREAAIGARLFPGWNTHREDVLKLVSDESTSADLGPLTYSIPFTLSPVHGDLNANNVLLWLEHEKYPFLIDLPFYQDDGHALQDFARLEVEILFALLDRQEESPPVELAAYDYTNSQVALWIEMEGRLHESRALDEFELSRARSDRRRWKADGFKDNLTLCYKLIMFLRGKACEVQQKVLDGPPPAPFAAEYLPALLYHTIRAIGYPSLSVFKRLLAVRSAGLILKSLERVLNAKP